MHHHIVVSIWIFYLHYKVESWKWLNPSNCFKYCQYPFLSNISSSKKQSCIYNFVEKNIFGDCSEKNLPINSCFQGWVIVEINPDFLLIFSCNLTWLFYCEFHFVTFSTFPVRIILISFQYYLLGSLVACLYGQQGQPFLSPCIVKPKVFICQ